MTAEVRVAVIGLGEFGRRYLRALGGLAGVEVAWATDLDGSRCRAASEDFGVRTTTELDDVLGDGSVDAVVVVTPEHAHRAVTVAALEAGKHALVEKPLATADEDALAMMAAARRTGTLLLPAFLLRFDRRYALAAERVAALGPVRSAYAWRNFDRGLFRLYSRTHSFIENAIHDIDLLGWLIGSPVVRVTGVCRTNLGLPNPDVNWGLLEYESGAVAALQTTWLYPEQAHDDLQWNAGIQLMADGGVVEVSYDQGGLRANTEASGILLLDQSAWADVAGEPRGAFGAMLRHVIACLQGRVEYQGATAEDALASMRVARALVASAEQGTPIDVAFGKDLSA